MVVANPRHEGAARGTSFRVSTGTQSRSSLRSERHAPAPMPAVQTTPRAAPWAMLRVGGNHKPGIAIKTWIRVLSWLRHACTPTVVVDAPDGRYLFRCPTLRTLKRACTLFVKESGTIDWLRHGLRPGDVFLDIGANVGVYSIYAAHCVGHHGRVYAVEPHVFNAATLIENVHANRMSERISVLTLPLSFEPVFDQFFYHEFDVGVANNEFGRTRAGPHTRFCGSELKYATTVDELIRTQAIRSPDIVKVDVDGLEPSIVMGMSTLLVGAKRPRSVQIEVDPEQREAVESLMASFHYRLDHRHYTVNGKQQLRQGAPDHEVLYNGVYVPDDSECERASHTRE